MRPEARAHYEEDASERDRLTQGHGVLEFLRTQSARPAPARRTRPGPRACATHCASCAPAASSRRAVISRVASTADGLRLADPARRERLLAAIRRVESVAPALLAASPHLLIVGRAP